MASLEEQEAALEEQEAAIETISACRREASILRQCGMFPDVVRHLMENAKAAERWLVQQTRMTARAPERRDG